MQRFTRRGTNSHWFPQAKLHFPKDKKKFQVLQAEDYMYLNPENRGVVEIPEVDDAEEFQRTLECMDVLNFDQNEKDDVLRIVSAVLRIGNIQFIPDEGQHGGSIVDCNITIFRFLKTSLIISR